MVCFNRAVLGTAIVRSHYSSILSLLPKFCIGNLLHNNLLWSAHYNRKHSKVFCHKPCTLTKLVQPDLFANCLSLNSKFWTLKQFSILGDPGATSWGRCDIFGRVTFLARKFISRAEEPLGTFSYQTSSRSVKIRSADWPEKYFSGQSTRRSSRVILSPLYTKCFSSSIEREDSREAFQKEKKDLSKPRRSQTVTWELAFFF